MPALERMSPTPDEPWDKIITPRHGIFLVPLRELWHYRDLIVLLAKRNITTQYKQMVLGPAWFVIQPLLATFVFSFIFGRLAGLGTEHIPHYLFYMSGIIFFNFFSECVNKIAGTFLRNATLFSKVYFPRLAVPCGQAITNLASFGVQFIAFLIGLAYYLAKMRFFPDALHPVHLHPNLYILCLPLLLIQLSLFGIGAGLIVASLTTRYRDLQMAVPFAVQVCMFASSVVFPLSKIKGASYVSLLKLNPLVPVVEAFRFAFLGEGDVTRFDLLTSFVSSLAIFLIGLVIFSRVEQTVSDTL